ncbi:MAG: DUF1674 domain-containing protein [Gammaproteobacteria bacterium]|nr:MAG: DUF1674 domain-containing protein [Gammaproteobacteria bacterium]
MTNSHKTNLDKKNQPGAEANGQQVTADEIKEKQQAIDKKVEKMPKEIGGRPKDKGLEPTRYGDWEFKGRCIDF